MQITEEKKKENFIKIYNSYGKNYFEANPNKNLF